MTKFATTPTSWTVVRFSVCVNHAKQTTLEVEIEVASGINLPVDEMLPHWKRLVLKQHEENNTVDDLTLLLYHAVIRDYHIGSVKVVDSSNGIGRKITNVK